MKTIFRFLGSGALTAVLIGFGAAISFGQDTPPAQCADVDGHNAQYTKFTGVYQTKVLEEKKAALALGKEYLEKYGACEAFKEQVDFVKPHDARLEKEIERGATFARYDAGVKANNPDEILAAGKTILGWQPDDVNIMVPMALASFVKSTKDNNFKWADDGIRYADMAASKLKGGWAPTRKDKAGKQIVGVLDYTLPADVVGGELSYASASLRYYGKKDKKGAVPQFYELSQGSMKSDPRVYVPIGEYYIEEGAPIGDEIAALIKKLKEATDDAVKEDLDKQIKAKIAMFNGYLERAIDALGRAEKVAKPGPQKDGLQKQLQILYKRRTDKDTGMEAFVAGMISKPFPNPTTPVTPVSDPEPTPTTTTTTTTSAPAASTPTKPLSTAAPAKATVAKKAGQK